VSKSRKEIHIEKTRRMEKKLVVRQVFSLSELSLNLPLYTEEKSKGVQYGTYSENRRSLQKAWQQAGFKRYFFYS
jgi:hypothetical protein